MRKNLRNIAIIAHVDHGKTTLVDKLLQQSGTLGRGEVTERIMDSNELEKERGITILAKNTAINWVDANDTEYRINIVDTPGHADFGGEVERIMSMVDSVLLLVDAVDGPMPQTRFVTQKAFAKGLSPIVVINKIDRPGARPEWVMDRVFDLFDNLGATDTQLDFPVIYTSALQGYACDDYTEVTDNMDALFKLIVDKVPAPDCDLDGPFQMQITSLDYSSYVGAIGIGKITRGRLTPNTPVGVLKASGEKRNGKILQVLGYLGLDRVEVDKAEAGDIVAVTGIEGVSISDTICAKDNLEALPPLVVDEPTVSITVQVNDSPFAGKEGKFVTSRQIKDRLEKELIHNVALKVEPTADPDKFKLSGRGELHLSILIETMRREGFELAIGRPEVITKEENGQKLEPFEFLALDIEEQHQGALMERMGMCKADLTEMVADGKGRVRLDYVVPARGLIGFHADFLTMTSGTGIANRTFSHYGKAKEFIMPSRTNGVLISKDMGKATAYSLWNLQARGKMIIGPQTEVYEGMVIGIHSRDNDLVVNVIKGKQLTNIRASGSDENIILTPPIRHTLEQALGFIMTMN